MYKLLLCWRYLLTRYLALVCIVSVMLGVATLIVVNSVMAGFSTKLRDRLHGLLSDVVVESWDYNGFPDPEGKMDLIRADPYLDSHIEAMTPTLEIFAMLQFNVNGTPIIRGRSTSSASIPKAGRPSAASPNTSSDQADPAHPSFELSRGGLRHHLQAAADHRMQCAAAAAAGQPGRLAAAGPAAEQADGRARRRHRRLRHRPLPRSQIDARTPAARHPTARTRRRRRHHDRQRRRSSARSTTASSSATIIKLGNERIRSNYVFVPLDYLQKLRHDGRPRHQHPDPPQGLQQATRKSSRIG